MHRMLGCFLVAVATAAAAHAQDAPAFLARVRSLDQLIANAQLIAKAVGKSEILRQYEGLVKSKVGRDGLAGIDPGRPIGFYIHVGKDVNDFRGAVLVPVKEEQAFLDLFKSFNLAVTKGKDNIYTVSSGGLFDFYLQFDRKYAHVTALNTLALDAKHRLDAPKLLGDGGPILSMALRIDQLPMDAKFLAKSWLEDAMEKAQAGARVETPAQKAFRLAVNKEILLAFERILQEGRETRLSVDIKDGKEATLEVSTLAVPGTELAKNIDALGRQQSLFGGQRAQKAAVGVGLNVHASEQLLESLLQVVQEAKDTALASIQNDEKKKQAEQLFAKIQPTLQAGELDVHGRLTGPKAGAYSGVLILKVAKGQELGATVHSLMVEMLKSMPEEKKKIVQLDAEKVGAVSLHKFSLPGNPFLPRWAAGGVATSLTLAFHADMLVLGVGDEGTALVREALAGAKSAAAPVFELTFDMAAFAPMIAPTNELRATALKLFPNEEEGKVRITLEGGGALRFTVATRLAVLEFLSLERKAEAKAN
jgi:hypothetical protein